MMREKKREHGMKRVPMKVRWKCVSFFISFTVVSVGMKKVDNRSVAKSVNLQSLVPTIQREEFGTNPSPPFKLEIFTFPPPSQKRFLLNDGYFSKEGVLFSNSLFTIERDPPSIQTPPADELAMLLSERVEEEEERESSEVFQKQY
jgi:hypothetical protein